MARIAVYDSGVGGLSILAEIQKVLPDSSLVFISDNAEYPYGTKEDLELLGRVMNVGDRLVNRYQPDLLVMACNTASTVCLPTLRARLTVPVVGVVPAIKPAAIFSQTRTIGLLATPATIKRPYTDHLIDDYASDCHVVRVGSSELVDMAESKLAGKPVDKKQLSKILAPFAENSNLDALVLACTHFPLLKDEITQVLTDQGRPDVHLVDSGQAIARQVARLLSVPNEVDARTYSASLVAALTRLDPVSPLLQHLESVGFDTIEQL